MSKAHDALAKLSPDLLTTVTEQQKAITRLSEVWHIAPTERLSQMVVNHCPELTPIGIFPSAEEAGALVTTGRQYLATSATAYEIEQALHVLAEGVKWPGEATIHDQESFLNQMAHRLLERGYPASILFAAVLQVGDIVEWISGRDKVLSLCEALRTEVTAAIYYLTLPQQEQEAIAYDLKFVYPDAGAGMARQLVKQEQRHLRNEAGLRAAQAARAARDQRELDTNRREPV
jgi:hypothetical protein